MQLVANWIDGLPTLAKAVAPAALGGALLIWALNTFTDGNDDK